MPKAPAGRPAGVPKPYLRAGSKVWQVKVKVPKGAGGPAQIARSLKTEDEAEAKRRAPMVVAGIRAEIEARRRHPDGTRKDRAGDPTAEQRRMEAWWAERRKPNPRAPGRFVIPEELEPAWDAELERVLGDPVAEDHHAGPVFAPEREAAAQQLIGVTLGDRLPVDHELSRYLAQNGVKASYAARTKSAVRRLGSWLALRAGGDNVHAVDGPTADRFADHLAEGDITTLTVNSLVSALSAYWKWMKRRQIVAANPWVTLQLPTVDRSRNAEKRAFTDDEIVALLTGPASPTLHDIMRIAALSGMRLNEIGNLRVRDAQDGVFNVTEGKTAAARRQVPIHSDLEFLLARRLTGKGSEAFLIEELTTPASRPNRRGGKVGERFTEYRRSLGIDAKQEGRRQADADFHSFRRWFVTKAEQAGNLETLIQAVVGHKRAGVTLGVYSGGPSVVQKRAVVESVRLPEGALVASPEGPIMGQMVTRRRTTGGQRS